MGDDGGLTNADAIDDTDVVSQRMADNGSIAVLLFIIVILWRTRRYNDGQHRGLASMKLSLPHWYDELSLWNKIYGAGE